MPKAQITLSCATAFSILKQGRVTCPSFHVLSVLFCGYLGQQSRQFCLLIIIRSGLLPKITLSVCMSKSHRILWVSYSRTSARLCIYHLLVWSNLNFLHISQRITLPSQSFLDLFSFCGNLLHSLTMWLVVSSLLLHSLHLLFCLVLSILTLIWFVLMALSCAAFRRDSVSLLRLPFLRQVRVFWYEIVLIRRLKLL